MRFLKNLVRYSIKQIYHKINFLLDAPIIENIEEVEEKLPESCLKTIE